jgi:hypothetical protein
MTRIIDHPGKSMREQIEQLTAKNEEYSRRILRLEGLNLLHAERYESLLTEHSKLYMLVQNILPKPRIKNRAKALAK